MSPLPILYTWGRKTMWGKASCLREQRWPGLGVEPLTFRSEVQRAKPYTTVPHEGEGDKCVLAMRMSEMTGNIASVSTDFATAYSLGNSNNVNKTSCKGFSTVVVEAFPLFSLNELQMRICNFVEKRTVSLVCFAVQCQYHRIDINNQVDVNIVDMFHSHRFKFIQNRPGYLLSKACLQITENAFQRMANRILLVNAKANKFFQYINFQ